MKRIKALLFLLPLLGCASKPSFEVKWITPTGIPTLAFFDQGDNKNWFSTSSPGDFIPAAFASDNYDAIVFDAVSGLTNIKKNSRNFVLARLLSQGTFYVISNKHKSGDEVKSTYTVDAFVKTGNCSVAFNKLQKDVWKWGMDDSRITYETGVDMVKTNFLSNPDSFDYFVVAEPVLTVLKNTRPTLNVIYDLRKEWSDSFQGAFIPAAGLFVNKTSYASNKEAIDKFLTETDNRIVDAVSTPSKAFDALKAYEAKYPNEPTKTVQRFGYKPEIVNELQDKGSNRFGLLKKDDVKNLKDTINDFQTKVGSSNIFDSALFLS